MFQQNISSRIREILLCYVSTSNFTFQMLQGCRFLPGNLCGPFSSIFAGQSRHHGRQARMAKILPVKITSVSQQVLVQVKCAEVVNHKQQYLREEAFESS